MEAKKGNLENQTFKRSSRDSDDIYLMVLPDFQWNISTCSLNK